MAGIIRVRRITVDYVVDAKSFTLQFTDPGKIASIVLDRDDLQRAQDMQTLLSKAPGSTVRRVSNLFFDPTALGPVATGITIATSEETPTNIAGPLVWWHSDCIWTHPNSEQPPASG